MNAEVNQNSFPSDSDPMQGEEQVNPEESDGIKIVEPNLIEKAFLGSENESLKNESQGQDIEIDLNAMYTEPKEPEGDSIS